MHSIFQVAVAVAALSTFGLSFAECKGKGSARLACDSHAVTFDLDRKGQVTGLVTAGGVALGVDVDSRGKRVFANGTDAEQTVTWVRNGKSRSLRLAPCWAELVPDAD